MKILFITPGKLPVPAVKGGAVENLIQILLESSLLYSNNEIEVIGIKDIEAQKKYKNYSHIQFHDIDITDPMYKILRAIRYIINRIPFLYIGNEYIKRVDKFLKKRKQYYDVIIVENSPEYALKLKHKYAKKMILHLHNDFLNKKTDTANKILLSYDKIFCLSDYVSNRVGEINKNYKNIYTLYNGIDTKAFKKIEQEKLEEYRKKYNLLKNDFIYIYSGRITKEKGVLELIKAFNILSKEEQNMKLLICGSIKKDSYYKELENASKKNANIIFTDYIDYYSLVYLYNIADVGIVPSIVEEGFGLILIENMACGNPVIISNSGGMPELVNNSVGIVFDKRDNFINNLYQSMKKIKNMKFDENKIIKHSHLFTKEKYISRFIKLLGGEKDENK